VPEFPIREVGPLSSGSACFLFAAAAAEGDLLPPLTLGVDNAGAIAGLAEVVGRDAGLAAL